MPTITQLAIRPSGWIHSRSIRGGGLLVAALTAIACGPAPPNVEEVPAKSIPDPDVTAARAPAFSFYERSSTYTSRAVDDGFWKTSTPAAQSLNEKVLSGGAAALALQKSAFSLLIIRNGFLVMERYFNGSRANHSNNIHSASKSIISALVGIALQRGLLESLDQTLDTMLPRHRMKNAATANITLRELLNMSSGLAWEEDVTEDTIEKSANWVQAILDRPNSSKPGTKFNYSTGNVHLLSAILTEASGQPLPDFATAALFKPLGITFEHWGKDPQGIASGGYNFYLTPRALARFALMVANGGKSGSEQLVPADWIASSIRSAEPAGTGYHYGYLYWLPRISGHAVAQMWGYGGQFAYLIPDANMVVVLTNNTRTSYPEPDGDAFLAKHVLPAILKR